MEIGRLIGGVVLLVVGAVLLYYLYDYMFNVGAVQKKAEIVAGPIASTSIVTPYTGGTQLKNLIFTGGEMSVSFWMYVTGSQANSTGMKHIVHLGTSETGNDNNNVFAIMLGPTTSNSLIVKVADSATTTAGFNLNTFSTTPPDTSEVCNISNVEFGRWVNVVVVLNNNTCDVYVDGKLSRSCVLKTQYYVPNIDGLKFYVLQKNVGATSAQLATATPSGGSTTAINTGVSTWNGSLASLNFFNYALSPDEAYRLYFAGPSGSSGDLWSAIKAFFGTTQKAAAVFTQTS